MSTKVAFIMQIQAHAALHFTIARGLLATASKMPQHPLYQLWLDGAAIAQRDASVKYALARHLMGIEP